MASSVFKSGTSSSIPSILNNNSITNNYAYTSAYDLYKSVGLLRTPLPGIYLNTLGEWWARGFEELLDKSSYRIAKGVTKGPLMALGIANDITSIVQIWNADAATNTKIGATLLYGQDYLGATCSVAIGAFYGAQMGIFLGPGGAIIGGFVGGIAGALYWELYLKDLTIRPN